MLVTHKISLRLPSGHSGLVLTLSNAACSSLFFPLLLVGDTGVWGYFSAGSFFWAHNLWVLFIFPSQLGCPPRFKNFPRPISVRVSWCLETSSFKTPLSEWISVPSSIFIFYILSYLLLKTMGCFSGCLMSSATDQKLFCEVCPALNCSFDEFVGEKVVSLSNSSVILAPPPVFFKTFLTLHN